MNATVTVPMEVSERDDGAFVACTPMYPDLTAVADSRDGAAGELAVLIRDRLVADYEAEGGTIRSVTRVDRDGD